MFCCILRVLTQLLPCPGVHHVFDTTFSRNFSLLESQQEFVRRFHKQAEDKKALPMLASACPGMASVPAAIPNPAAAQEAANVCSHLQDYSPQSTDFGAKAVVRHLKITLGLHLLCFLG